ncbi:MAG: hypothetical protein ACJ796_09305 [Gemmatimonadaceae bacterium]
MTRPLGNSALIKPGIIRVLENSPEMRKTDMRASKLPSRRSTPLSAGTDTLKHWRRTAPQLAAALCCALVGLFLLACSPAKSTSIQQGMKAIEVAPKNVTTIPGAIINFNAKFLSSTGSTSTATGATWSSSNTAIVHVSNIGAATTSSIGNAWVYAKAGDLSDSARVTVAAAPPPVSTTCTNEPAGLTAVSDQGWNAVPPNLDALDAAGWGVDRDRQNLAIVADPTAPRSPSNVIHGVFPAGNPGGTAPFRVERPFGTQRYTTIFECVWLMHSANFTDNHNLGTKVAFYRGPGQNNYWAFDGGVDSYDGFYFFFGIQGGGGDRDIRAKWSAKPLGVWHKYEVLTISNTPGQNNGILRVWADGQLIMDYTDVAFWSASQTPGWTGVAWEPVYGGGLNPIPVTMFQAIDHWYVSAK